MSRVVGWIGKSPLRRGFIAFLGLNALFVAPIVVLLCVSLPQTVEVDVVADGPVSIALCGARLSNGEPNFCFSSELYDLTLRQKGTSHVFEGRFPGSFDFGAPSFLIRSDSTTNIVIENVRITVGAFSKILTPSSVAMSYRIEGDQSLEVDSNGMVNVPLLEGICRLIPSDDLSWSRWCVLPRENTMQDCGLTVFVGFEILLLMVSLGVSCLRRRTSVSSFYVCQTLSLAALAVFFFFFVVPFQSYFTNAEEYPFSVLKLMADIIPYSLAFLLIVFSSLLLTEFVFGRVAHFVLFAILVYEYLEVGILSIGAPPFVGDLSYYFDMGLETRDWFVLVYSFVFVLVPYVKLARYFHWMLACFFVMAAASLLDAGVCGCFIGRRTPQSKWDCARDEVPLKVVYSKRNIIVFVVDSVTVEAAKDALLSSKTIEKSFDGFTAFDRNIGAQYQTDLATVNIFTGGYYKGRSDRANVQTFFSQARGDDSVLLDYLKSQFGAYCMAPNCVFGHGFISNGNNCENAASIEQKIPGNSAFWRPHGLLSTSVLTLSLFRMTPFGLKVTMYQQTSPFFGFAEESYIYPYFRAAPVNNNSAGTFLYCHTWGAHCPHDVSEDGVRHGIDLISYHSNVLHVKAVLSELAKTLESYRKKGIYDGSTILVIADHGSHLNADAKRIDTREDALPLVAFPMLWVKPANSRGPIVFDETTPTTHANLHKVLRSLKDRDLSTTEIATMLRSDRRVFIRQTRDGYDQWDVSADGTVLSRVHHIVK